MASIITINLISDKAESLLPELAQALHVDGFDRAIPGKAQVYFNSSIVEHPESVRWVQDKITEHGWDDDFLVRDASE